MPPQQELNVQVMQNMQEKNGYDELNLRGLYKRKVEETMDNIHKIRKEMHLIGKSNQLMYVMNLKYQNLKLLLIN